MLSGQELSATFLVHGGWTERTIGLAGGHFGEKAFQEKELLNHVLQKQEVWGSAPIYYTEQWIHAGRKSTGNLDV
jgi:hypothetical protein